MQNIVKHSKNYVLKLKFAKNSLKFAKNKFAKNGLNLLKILLKFAKFNFCHLTCKILSNTVKITFPTLNSNTKLKFAKIR